MLRRLVHQPWLFALIITLVLAGAAGCLPDSRTRAGEPLSAKASELAGAVAVKPGGTGDFIQLLSGQEIPLKSQVWTNENSRARLDLSNGILLRLEPGTVISMESYEATGQGSITTLRMDSGRIWAILDGGVLIVQTSGGVASVSGSYMSVQLQPDTGQLSITCLEGNCSLQTPGGRVDLVAGESAFVPYDDAPPLCGLMTDVEVSEWLRVNPEVSRILPVVTVTRQALFDQPALSADRLSGCLSPSTPTAIPSSTSTPTLLAATATATAGLTSSPTASLTPTSQYSGYQVVATAKPKHKKTKTPTPSLEPTNTPAEFTNPGGPADPHASCTTSAANTFRVTVADPDGIAWVKLQYRLNSDPWDESKTFSMTQSGDWQVTSMINTEANTGLDTVFYRFWSQDLLGEDTFSGEYSYTDSLDCGAASWIGYGGPFLYADTCDRQFIVDIKDPDGIAQLMVLFSKTSGSYNLTDAVAFPLTGAGTSLLTVSENMFAVPPFTVTAGETIYYRFYMQDAQSVPVEYYKPATGDYQSYVSNVACPYP